MILVLGLRAAARSPKTRILQHLLSAPVDIFHLTVTFPYGKLGYYKPTGRVVFTLLLIQRGGGTGPVKPRQPPYLGRCQLRQLLRSTWAYWKMRMTQELLIVLPLIFREAFLLLD